MKPGLIEKKRPHGRFFFALLPPATMRPVATKRDLVLEGYSARLRAPFAVLAIQTRRERLVEIEYLPPAAATLAPIDAFAREVCRQLRAYFRDPDFQFDLPCDAQGGARRDRRSVRGARMVPMINHIGCDENSHRLSCKVRMASAIGKASVIIANLKEFANLKTF